MLLLMLLMLLMMVVGRLVAAVGHHTLLFSAFGPITMYILAVAAAAPTVYSLSLSC